MFPKIRVQHVVNILLREIKTTPSYLKLILQYKITYFYHTQKAKNKSKNLFINFKNYTAKIKGLTSLFC